MQGGEVFHREIDGEEWRFEVAGVWGGGNVLTEREALFASPSTNTLYNTWNGEGLTGPREDLSLEVFPALWGTLPWNDFVDRFQYLGSGSCEVYNGTEVLGVGCTEACPVLGQACSRMSQDECISVCTDLPRSQVACLETLDSCDVSACKLDWEIGELEEEGTDTPGG